MLRCSAIIRVTLGVLLLVAAGLKLYGLGVSAMPAVGWFAQSWIQLAAAEWELVLGLWLISGAYPKASWFAAIGTFLTFAGVSAYLGFSGAASCGCLGAVQTSPWWAFGVDVAALAMLGFSYPRGERNPSASKSTFVKWIGGIAVLIVATTIAASIVYGSPEIALARLRGESLIVSDINLGAGKPGKVLEGIAIIRNVSEHRIRLIGGNADCLCTVLCDLPIVIEPGASALMRVIVTIPSASAEHMSRWVVLRTDDESQPTLRFRVNCSVE